MGFFKDVLNALTDTNEFRCPYCGLTGVPPGSYSRAFESLLEGKLQHERLKDDFNNEVRLWNQKGIHLCWPAYVAMNCGFSKLHSFSTPEGTELAKVIQTMKDGRCGNRWPHFPSVLIPETNMCVVCGVLNDSRRWIADIYERQMKFVCTKCYEKISERNRNQDWFWTSEWID